jgi:uncharacterized protein YndB with AHSA1/START domain
MPAKPERIDTAARTIAATPEAIYRAWVDPDALARWLPPKGMACRIDDFDPRQGGAFRMVLSYLDLADGHHGKSGEGEDAVEGRFIALEPGRRIVQDIVFRSQDPAFAGTMRMTWDFAPTDAGAEVTITAKNVPSGITPEDHAAGLAASLENLAAFVELRPMA